MKSFFKKGSALLLSFVLTFGFTYSSVSATGRLEPNKIDANVTEGFEVSLENNQLEKVKIAEFDVNDLKIGDNEIYNDGETVVSLRLEVPIDSNSIKPMVAGDSGWSAGWIGSTATLYPSRRDSANEMSYVLFWHNNSINSVHSLSYKVALGTVTNTLLTILNPTPGSTYASAIGEVQYVVTQWGGTPGSYNNWLRTDINNSGQVRTVWNY